VFALGAIAWEMLSGRPAFQGESVLALLACVEEARLAPCPDLDPRVESVLRRALAREPADRFADGEALAVALDDVLRLPRETKRARVAGAAVVVLGAAVLGVLALRDAPPPPPPPPPAPAPTPPPVPEPRNGDVPQPAPPEAFRGKHVRVRRTRGEYAWRHADTVHGVVVLDERRAASVAKDGVLHVWDLATGLERTSLAVAASATNGLARRPGHEQVVVATHDHALAVWDLGTGKRVLSIPEMPFLLSVAVSPDGRRALAGGTDGRVYLVDLETGVKLREMAAHKKNVFAVAFLPDGRHGLSGGDDALAKLWDLETGQLVRALAGHSSHVAGIAVTPDGRRAFTASHDETVGAWDLETGRRLATLQGHDKIVYSVALSPDGRLLASGGKDQRIVIHDAVTLESVRTIDHAHNAAVLTLAFTADGKSLVSGSIDRTVGLFDVASGRDRRALVGPTSVAALALAGDRVASTGWDGTVRILGPGGEAVLPLHVGHWGRCVAASPDGTRFLSAASEGNVRVIDAATARPLGSMPHGGDVIGVAFAHDGAGAFSIGRDKRLVAWDLGTALATREVTLPLVPRVVAFAPDGTRALLGHGVVNDTRVIQLGTGDEVHRLKQSSGVTAVAWAPDGKSALTGGEDGSVALWDLETGKLVEATPAHHGWVQALAVAPDGRRAATSGLDHVIRIADATSGRELDRLDLTPRMDEVEAFAWSPDGRTLYAGTGRGVIMELEVD
jgi:WD40 repeat protein